MADILLDFVDNLVNRNNDDDGAITTDIVNAEESWWSATGNETDALNYSDDDIDGDFCSIPTVLFDNFTAQEFSNTWIIRWMHALPPRRGYSKDVLDLIVGTEEQKRGACVCG